nr:NADH dehydrogenase subunit 2 [Scophthalmus aquosus]
MPSALPLLLMTSALIFGTTLTLSSSHWLLAWVGLEINTIAILPLLTKQPHPRAVEAAMKYFMIQLTASGTLLFACILNAWLTGEWAISQEFLTVPGIIAVIALALKVGLAPLHAWLPEILQGLTLTIGMLLVTWQKIAPIALLYQMNLDSPKLFTALALMSTIMGAWGALNQTQLRKILAYSSIAHLGWVVLIMQYSAPLAILTLAVYFILTIPTFLIFNWKKALSINTLAASSIKTPTLILLIPLVLLSLGGLPPLTGFMPKLLTLAELVKQNLPMLATIIALTALLSLFFYFRVMSAVALCMAPHISASLAPSRTDSPKYQLALMSIITAALLLIPLCPSVSTLALVDASNSALEYKDTLLMNT